MVQVPGKAKAESDECPKIQALKAGLKQKYGDTFFGGKPVFPRCASCANEGLHVIFIKQRGVFSNYQRLDVLAIASRTSLNIFFFGMRCNRSC